MPALIPAEKSEPARTQSQKIGSDIIRAIIDASLASYSGNCPCPYPKDRAGRSCGHVTASSAFVNVIAISGLARRRIST